MTVSELDRGAFCSLFLAPSPQEDVVLDSVSTTDSQLTELLKAWFSNQRLSISPIEFHLGAVPSVLTSMSAVYLPKFNAGILIEPKKNSRFLVSCFICYLDNTSVSSSLDVTIPSPFTSKLVQHQELSQWLSFVSEALNQAWDCLLPKSQKAGSEQHETREPNNPEFFSEYLWSLLPGDLLPLNTEKFVLKDRVYWNNQKYCWRRSGAYTVFSQVITYLNGSRSWEGDFLKYSLEIFCESSLLSPTDIEYAVGELKLLGIDFKLDESVSSDSDGETGNGQKPIVPPRADVYVSFDFPSDSLFNKPSKPAELYGVPTTPSVPILSSVEQLEKYSKLIINGVSNFKKLPAYDYSYYLLFVMESFIEIHKQAVAAFPSLAQYRIPFPFLENFRYLQYVSLDSRERFDGCFNYLTKLNEKNNLPHILEMTRANSFQVVEAGCSSQMTNFISKILKEDETSRQAKRSEVLSLKDDQERDRKSIQGVCCSCEYAHDRRGRYYKVSTCNRCTIASRMSSRSCSLFENRLPNCRVLQLSIAFDCFLPSSISVLYDAYVKVCRCLYRIGKSDVKLYGKWSNFLSQYPSSSLYLDADRKSFTQSHYYSRQIDNPIDDFTENCARTVVLASELCGFGFNVEESLLPNSITPPLPPPYASLLPYLDCIHTQNDVMARQSECPKNLLLSKWHAFGTLRAGFNLALSNTLSALSSKVLDFNHEAVHRLLECVWWEIGAHELKDIYNNEFLSRLCREIITFAEFYSVNWDRPGLMYSLLIILDRISEFFTGDVLREAYDVIRTILHDWKQRCNSDLLPIISAYHLIAHKAFKAGTILSASTLMSLNTYSLNFYSLKVQHAVLRSLSQHSAQDFSSAELNDFIFDMVSVKVPSTIAWNKSGSWIYCDYNNQRFEIDRVIGTFLVNRKTPKNLPLTIRQTSAFVRLFGSQFNPETVVFEHGYRTRNQYSGFVYEFHDDSNIYQIEIESGKKWIYSVKCPNNLPHSFNMMYHWYSDGILEFREHPLMPSSTLFILTRTSPYVTSTRLEMLSIVPLNSKYFKYFKQFFTIEQDSLIEVYVINSQFSHILLPRFNLRFTLQTRRLFCETLQKFVAPHLPTSNLSIPNSLDLVTDKDQYLLVPYGDVTHNEIKLPAIGKTMTYFIYKYHIKFDLFKYEGTENGWLYLALLYGMFNTNRTGLYISLHLLQTVCFPTKRFNQQARDILEAIQELSPSRGYYPEHLKNMEQVVYPEGLDYIQASDLYDVLVCCLFALNDNDTKVSIDFLRLRAYADMRHLYPKLSDFFENMLPKELKKISITVSTKNHVVWSEVPDLGITNCEQLLAFTLPGFLSIQAFWDQLRAYEWDQIILDEVFTPVMSLLNHTKTPDEFQLACRFLQYILWSSGACSFAAPLLHTLSSVYPDKRKLEISAPYRPRYNWVDKDDDWAVFENGSMSRFTTSQRQRCRELIDYLGDLKKLHSKVKSFLIQQSHTQSFVSVLKYSLSFTYGSAPFYANLTHPWCTTVNQIWDHLTNPVATSFDFLQTCLEDVLELNVRPQQLLIAKHMLNSTSSIQTQLHMGEGKSTVIVPLIVLGILLAKLIPRINVIRSQLVTCVNKYVNTFGLMGIRLSLFSCSRKSSHDCDFYSNLLYNSNVLICAPEDRQSFFLKSKSVVLHSTWFDNIKEVIDESDDQFDPKNQLIYPYGDPQTIDGGSLRWIAAESVLQGLLHFLQIEDDGFILPVLELPENLKEKILRFVLDGNTCLHRMYHFDFTTEVKNCIIAFALNSNSPLPELSASGQQLALVLRGYFLHGLINRALRLRYRVQYGIDERRNPIAVPFRARDVPALAAEFSDVDLVIFLTIISFYHSGLNEDQFKKVIENMTSDQYLLEEWTDRHFSFDSLILADYAQVSRLYRKIKFKFGFINYYLNHHVFPHFTKQFATKRSASPWHLASSKCPVTGFSGTNQSQSLLPFPVVQNDLDFVLHTNTEMDSALKRQKVVDYDGNVLNWLLAKPKIQILLDVGAVVEHSNEDFAKEWLKRSKTPGIQGVVYFKNDAIVVFDGKTVISLYDSPYATQLEKCLVFLDDFHTRGTDLKFPPKAVAAVTLYRSLSRDRVAQGSMRLRQLMSDDCKIRQSIVFLRPPDLKFKCIVAWLQSNTKLLLAQSRLTWTRQGISFIKDEEEIEMQTLEQLYREPPLPTTVGYLLNQSNICPTTNVYNFINRFSTVATTSAIMEEEQEKELEEELQEERQVQRPPPRSPRVPFLSQPVIDLMSGRVSHEFKPILRGLFGIAESSCLASTEFLRIYKDQTSDLYTRPASWVFFVGGVAVYLSPFEANALLAKFRIDAQSARSKGLYSVVPRRSKVQDIIPMNPNFGWKNNIPFNFLIGSTYFLNKQAEFDFCNFFNIFPKPRNENVELARNLGFINDEGFGTLDGKPSRFKSCSVPLLKRFFTNLYFDESIAGSPLHDVVFLMLKSRSLD
ncbi:hypothetical protein RCL1_006821 [Eukaryota sp. TZLM3-RCL]